MSIEKQNEQGGAIASLFVRRPVLAGIAYGVLLYVVMNFVVLPLSALPPHVWKPTLPALTDLCSHMLFVGVPIALATRRASKR